ncbi:MAG: 2-phosphosulfolactate phosphatase [Steroidobacteraceae bacterium]
MKVHVLLKKEELDGERLAGKVVVVLDVLFATSSIAAALAHGARSVVPATDRASWCRSFARARAAPELTDAARAASLLHDHVAALECLSASRVGNIMRERGAMAEVEFAVVPKLTGGRLRAL